jgi:mRNA-degrading endonuclease RelE of RelBE toxin-antitoxin system
MIVKYRKSFFTDLSKIRSLKQVQEVEFITEFAKHTSSPETIPGFKALRQYPTMARIEIAPYRIGVEIIENTIIFKRILPRAVFYAQFP